jgi:flagellar M-ring protein FliF
MEPLLKSFRQLPQRFTALSAGARVALIGGLALVIIGVVAASMLGGGSGYQYVFTNLTAEDSSEAAAALKAAGVPFRAEANGSALAVPANQVHEARLLLASAGIPRGGGVGFELFDRGDLGASEFTQRVNLRRATEGELSRTIGRLAAVRSARVHLTLPERGLYRDDDKKVSAAVVVSLQPGRSLVERELAGIRHLVASSVPGLNPESVTVMDGRGMVLSGDRSESARLATQQREVESGLEQRIVELIEPAVGAGAVVAKVTAQLDTSEVETTSDVYDPDGAAVRSTRKTNELTRNESSAGGGVAGAAANVPLDPAAGGGQSARGVLSTREDEVKNYEVSKKVTRSLVRTPRLQRLSAAVLVDGVDGKPRPEPELRRLAELAKHAMGFDQQRGDTFDISSAPFSKRENGTDGAPPIWARPELVRLGTFGLIALVILAGLGLLVSKARAGGAMPTAATLLRPGAKVGEVQAALAGGGALPAAAAMAALPPGQDSAMALRDRARELGKGDPSRAANLLRAWVTGEELKEPGRG